MNNRITKKRLLELLDIYPDTGIARWKVWRPNGVKVGDVAGSNKGDGYLRICLDNRRYGVHNIIWFFVNGTWPRRIDHEDRDTTHNWIENLRVASRAQNMHNSKVRSDNRSGLKGVSLRANGTYEATVTVGGKKIYSERFNSKIDAHRAYCVVAKRTFGEFFFDGKSGAAS